MGFHGIPIFENLTKKMSEWDFYKKEWVFKKGNGLTTPQRAVPCKALVKVVLHAWKR
jgi:hypothetical protein